MRSVSSLYAFVKGLESLIETALGRATTASAGVIASVAHPADLTPISTANAVTGAEAYVTIQKSRWKLDKTSTAGVDGVTSVLSFDGGRWLRDLSYVHLRNSVNANWFIDPASIAGDADNDGFSALTPLKTWAEFARRVGMGNGGAAGLGTIPTFNQAVIVKFLTSQSGVGDPVYPIYKLGPSGSFTLQGTPTVVALTGGGTMSGVVARNRATDTPNKITNAGFTGANDWTALLDLQVHNITRDTISYPWFNNGGTVAKQAFMTEPMRRLTVNNSIGFVDVAAANVNTDTFEVLRPTTIFLAGWLEVNPIPGTFSTWQGISGAIDLKLSNFATNTAPVCINVSNPFFAQCQWDIGDIQFQQEALPYLFARLYNCAFSNLGITNGLTLANTNSLRVSYGVCRSEIFVTSSRGPFLTTDNEQTRIEGDIILTANVPVLAGPGGYVFIDNVGIFCTVGGAPLAGLFFDQSGKIHFNGALWGNGTGTSGPMGALFQFTTGGYMTYTSGITATWTLASNGTLAGIGAAGRVIEFQAAGNNGQAYNPGTGAYAAAGNNTIANLIGGATEGLHAPQFDIHFMPA